MRNLNPRGTLAFQRAMQAETRGDVAFTSHFDDRLPIRGLSEAGPLRPEELADRAEIVPEGRAAVFDSWNQDDMKRLSRIVDMAAKGLYRILVHQPSFPMQQDTTKPPRVCVYVVWCELSREIRKLPSDPTGVRQAPAPVQVPEMSISSLFPAASSAHIPGELQAEGKP